MEASEVERLDADCAHGTEVGEEVAEREENKQHPDESAQEVKEEHSGFIDIHVDTIINDVVWSFSVLTAGCRSPEEREQDCTEDRTG